MGTGVSGANDHGRRGQRLGPTRLLRRRDDRSGRHRGWPEYRARCLARQRHDCRRRRIDGHRRRAWLNQRRRRLQIGLRRRDARHGGSWVGGRRRRRGHRLLRGQPGTTHPKKGRSQNNLPCVHRMDGCFLANGPTPVATRSRLLAPSASQVPGPGRRRSPRLRRPRPNSQGSRIAALGSEEADAAGTPRLTLIHN